MIRIPREAREGDALLEMERAGNHGETLVFSVSADTIERYLMRYSRASRRTKHPSEEAGMAVASAILEEYPEFGLPWSLVTEPSFARVADVVKKTRARRS